MKIIPVIDLLGGHVVHARQGQRHDYRPIESPLCQSSDPFLVTETLLMATQADTCYVADLDAIQNHGAQQQLIADIAAKHPGTEFWIDSGDSTAVDRKCLQPARNIVPVAGTESFGDWTTLAQKLADVGPFDVILSLDFKDGTLLGPQEILSNVQIWPRRVIIMTLDHVGSNNGPAYRTLAMIGKPKDVQLYAAGGVRNQTDLHYLATAGIHGALVASALHNGVLLNA